jgi:hypothetical protein
MMDAPAAALRGSAAGGAWRSGNVCELTFPPLLWKLLLRERTTLHDLATSQRHHGRSCNNHKLVAFNWSRSGSTQVCLSQ